MTPQTFIEERDKLADEYVKTVDKPEWMIQLCAFRAGYNAALSSSLVKQLVEELEFASDELLEHFKKSKCLHCEMVMKHASEGLAAYNEAIKDLESR